MIRKVKYKFVFDKKLKYDRFLEAVSVICTEVFLWLITSNILLT